MLHDGRHGQHPPIDADHRAWLQRLIAACERILAEHVPDARDPYLRSVLADVEALRGRLTDELAAEPNG